MSALTLAHLNLDVADLERSARFYGDALALPVERTPTTVVVRQPSFLLVLSAGPPEAGGNFHFGFRVETRDEVDAWMAKLAQRGVPIVSPAERRGSTYVGRVSDPDADAVEIFAFV
ncbi:MAG: hypothetical protein NVSMB59_22970 [Vulcanimicrobiaceae bacterium]